MMRKTIKVLMAVLCVSLSLGVITACKKTEEPKKTKLDSPVIASKTYTGSNQTATVAENEAYEVTVNAGGTNVGEYDVVLTLTDTKKYEWTTPDADDKAKVTLKFTITKATNEITVLTLDDWAYGETPKTPTVTAKFGTAECTYATSENGEYIVTVPTAVGKYWVKATVAGTDNYTAATKTAQFEIKKAAATVTTAPAAKTELVYNRNAQELVTAGYADGGKLNYKLGENGTWSETIPAATDAGDYKVYYKVVGDESHSDTAETEIPVTIAQATNEITGISIAGWTYGETANEPTATAKFGTATFTYATSENGTYTETKPTDAGDYWVKATVAETKNYAGATQTLKFTIAKAHSAITSNPAANQLTYNGEAQALVTAGESADGTLQYKLGADGEWSENIPIATNAGEYVVYFRLKGDKNHIDIESNLSVVNVTIAKAAATVTAPTAKTELVYNGNAQALVSAGSVSDATLEYKLGDGEWGADVPTATNAGEYTVYYRVTVDNNHTGATEGSFKVVIAKAAASVTAPTAKTGLVYNGNAQALVSAGNVSDATLEYKLGDGEWGADVPAATNAGEYTVFYRVTVDSNHTGATEGSFKVAIAKAENELSITIPDVKYGEEPQPDLTARAGKETATFAYSLTQDGEFKAWDKKANKPNVGEEHYYVKGTVEETENYLGASAVKAFTVHKADNSVTDFALDNEIVKCGTEHELKFTVNKTGGAVVIKFSKAANGEFGENIPNDEVGNGLTYYAMAFVENDDCYVDAHSEAVAFTLTHNFVNGICSGCNHAQTNVTYEASGDVYGVKKYNGRSAEVYPLSVYEGKPVTFIWEDAFRESSITKIVLPESINDIQTRAFWDCAKLEYASITGVPSFNANNQFVNCTSLKTVIVNKDLVLNDQHFFDLAGTAAACADVYVNASQSEGKFAVKGGNNRLLTGAVYYKGDATKCLQWNFNENGEIVRGAASHNFAGGKCSLCGRLQTEGIVYTLNAEGTAYAITGYTGTDAEVYTVAEIDGVPVTSVADNAFNLSDDGNNLIKKVVLSDSINTIGGNAFFKCYALEYIEMKGVKELSYGNAFLNCFALKTVVVGRTFNLSGQAFKSTTDGEAPHIVLYVYGSEEESTVTAANSDMNNMFTGIIRYYSETAKDGCWHYENGVATLWN